MQISIVGGGGRVGLPLAILLAEQGHSIVVVDSDQNRVNLINSRSMPFVEIGIDEILLKLRTDQLIATTNNEKIRSSDVCILIIGTPVNDDGTPSANFIGDLVIDLSKYLQSTKLLILRSTVYPGITEEISNIIRENCKETLVAYCPERIAEGKALEELKLLPQIIGVDSEKAYDIAREVFRGVTPKFIKTTFKEAEITKLFANTYRYFKFAIANEFFQICQSNDINWENVWLALKQDYPRGKDLPQPGFAAGPCLVKDTMQLNYFARNRTILGKSAININENFPEYIVELLESKYDLKQMTVGILGMTFKADVDDFRASLSFKLKNILKSKSEKVLCSDELLQKDYFISSEKLIKDSDIVIIATPHSAYSRLIINKPLVDIWRISKSQSIF
jgi:UDP-N-acetyl-D-mannosaminuronic acid dehydrogenase